MFGEFLREPVDLLLQSDHRTPQNFVLLTTLVLEFLVSLIEILLMLMQCLLYMLQLVEGSHCVGLFDRRLIKPVW
jgi:hypothetical protein